MAATQVRDLHRFDFVFASAQEPELMYSFDYAILAAERAQRRGANTEDLVCRTP
jgi:hypothetical protein